MARADSNPTDSRRRRARPLGFLVLGLALLVLGLNATAASAAKIDFDELDAPELGNGSGLPVNVQYEGLGVTFNNPGAIDYSKGGSAIPGFPHSDNIAVETCLSAEFCKSPIDATFTAAQKSVKVWVGFDSPELGEPLGVRLTAYDASSTQVGVADATLPVRSGPTPIQTPLEVELPSAAITKIEVSVSTGGGYTGGLAVDDVEFSTVGPPPPCPATVPPTVNVEQPLGGFPQNNEFPLKGTVVANGALITSATVVAKSATTHTSSAFPALIGPTGGPFGLVRYAGLLSPGANEVVVTATNCRGTGTSKPRSVTFMPIAAGSHIHQLGMIEVSQSTQDTNNTVPLIAAAKHGVKRTYARVYLNASGTPSPIRRVTGTLTAIRPDGTRPPGPLSIHSLNEVDVVPGRSLEEARSSLGLSLNFELPPEWLSEGALHLQLGPLEVEGDQTSIPCDGCDNPGVGGPAVVHFHAVPPMHIWLLSVPYLPSPEAAPIAPRQFDVEMLSSWLRRAYPSAEIRITEETLPAQPGPPGALDEDGNRVRPGFLCEDLNSRINQIVSLAADEEPQARFYGMVSDSENHFMRGCSSIGGQVGSGPTGSGTFGWDGDGSYADWYGGHEIGHMFGRLHPGDCNQTDDDHSYPYPGGLIGDSAFDDQALDTGDAALGGPSHLIPPRVGDSNTGWHDVMTYCPNEWLSDYTYRGVLQSSCGADHPDCPGYALLSGGAGASSAGGAAPRPKGHGKAKLGLMVSGSLALSSGKVKLDPLLARSGLKLTTRPKKSPYAIDLLGATGRRLARYPFAPETLSDPPSPNAAKALIDEVVPFKKATHRIVVTKGGRTLASVKVSAHAPTVSITSPHPHAKVHGKVRMVWRSHDADGGRPTYTVVYHPSKKRSLPIASGLRKPSLSVDLSTLPGGSRASFEVIASDGVLTGSDRSAPLKVPVKSPRVEIDTPQQETTVGAGQPVGFQATIADLQDQQLPAASVVWTSSIQGVLGHGSTISAALAPGNHQITVRATNSGGKTSSAAVTVHATVEPLVVQAILQP